MFFLPISKISFFFSLMFEWIFEIADPIIETAVFSRSSIIELLGCPLAFEMKMELISKMV